MADASASAASTCGGFRAGGGGRDGFAAASAGAAAFRGAPPPPAPPPPPGQFDLLVLGSGCSTAVPVLGHVLRRECDAAGTGLRRCDNLTVCEEALRNPASKNRRHNVSVLLRCTPADGGATGHVMVDAGKTIREAVMEAFPKVGADTVQALLVTHGHADAILGIDDLRDLQRLEEVYDEARAFIGYRPAEGSGPLQVVSNRDTLERIRESFPYLCKAPELSRPGVMMRWMLWLEMEQLEEDDASLVVAGLPVRSFPVWHGGAYVSLGFAFGTKAGGRGHPLVYISDVKEVPPATMSWLESVAEAGIDVLMVDACSRQGHSAHFSLDDALSLARRLRPKRTLIMGIVSCLIGDHDEVNEELAALLASEGLDVQLAHDGLLLPPMAYA